MAHYPGDEDERVARAASALREKHQRKVRGNARTADH